MANVSATNTVVASSTNDIDWSDFSTGYIQLMGMYYSNVNNRLTDFSKTMEDNINTANEAQQVAEFLRNYTSGDGKSQTIPIDKIPDNVKAFFAAHPDLAPKGVTPNIIGPFGKPIPVSWDSDPTKWTSVTFPKGTVTSMQSNLSGFMDTCSQQNQMNMLTFQSLKNKLDQIVTNMTNFLQTDNETKEKVLANFRS